MVTIAAGIFILPFFLFSATAGQLSDKHDKAKLIRIIKFFEVLLMILAAIGFYTGNIDFLMFVLFLMGTQSAFFGPVKYGILPDQLIEKELVGGNALIQTGTFVSILIGTILGGLLILTNHGTILISTLVISVALIGWASSFFIPSTQAASPDITVKYNVFTETQAIIRHIQENNTVFRAILGISWFWLFGATFLSQLPTFTKAIIGGNEQIVTLFLAIFSIGIGIGSLLCNKLLKGEIAATYVPLGIIGMTLFTLDLYVASGNILIDPSAPLIGVSAYLETFTHWRILIDLLGIAVCGGIYIVPLYAMVQRLTESSYRSRTIAGNNIMNALFMVISAIGTSLMLASGFAVTGVFLFIAILNTLVAIYISSLLPKVVVRSIIQWLLHTFYRLDIKGQENLYRCQGKSIIIANHLSYLDALIIGTAISEKVSFAINSRIAQQWWMRPFLLVTDTITLDSSNPMSIRSVVNRVNQGHKVVIFPEGRLTMTGSVMKVYEGPALIADKTAAQLLPVVISGALHTPFSKLRGKVRIRLFPKITLSFMEPIKFIIPPHLHGRKRRQSGGIKLYDVMTNMMFQSNDHQQTLFDSVLDAKTIHGRSHVIAEDTERNPLSYHQLIARTFILGAALHKHTQGNENIGVLLPNMTSTIACFFGLQVFGRIPAMLNYSTSKHNMLSACQLACIQVVITSRKFIADGNLSDLVATLRSQFITIIYLEDLRHEITLQDKLKGQLAALAPRVYYSYVNKAKCPESPAVVLFTSGSEGKPKGVVLSHTNIQANRHQVSSRIDFSSTDIVFNSLPIFHSFGLTGGTLLPLLSGIRTFFYPSPLHYRIIPELIYDTNATLLFGTDTFLNGYARFAHTYDFQSIRYVFAGAEKLQESTRKKWVDNFGIRIFEGYGTTETSPILSINTPMHYQPGTVGRMMPGITYLLNPVPGIKMGGQLLVSGPNIMQGYYSVEQPGVIIPPRNGWYDTGDIVSIDGAGYITIRGRIKRFAKIAGEMVSLTAVETTIYEVWAHHTHAVVQIPDPKKGEQLVLVTTYPDANRTDIVKYVLQHQISKLNIPKTILTIHEMPVLPTGKTNYLELQEWVESMIQH